jgi:hypothetical protein
MTVPGVPGVTEEFRRQLTSFGHSPTEYPYLSRSAANLHGGRDDPVKGWN